MDGERAERGRAGETLAVVIPFYNEERFIGRTLACLSAQTRRPDQLVLVDNASSDQSARICRDFLMTSGIAGAVYAEPKPGKIHALETACRLIRTDVAAFWDADTYYPPHYLDAAMTALARAPRLSGVMAPDFPAAPTTFRIRLAHAKKRSVSALLAKQCHTGGFGQIFRTERLRAAGGFSAARWPYVLEDHEIAHCVLKTGPITMPADLWCLPSGRRADRTSVTWTLSERLLYHAVPFARKDWFFYSYLAKRFEARGLRNINLRDRAAFAPEGETAADPATVASA